VNQHALADADLGGEVVEAQVERTGFHEGCETAAGEFVDFRLRLALQIASICTIWYKLACTDWYAY
jgi:hypothetical protein